MGLTDVYPERQGHGALEVWALQPGCCVWLHIWLLHPGLSFLICTMGATRLPISPGYCRNSMSYRTRAWRIVSSPRRFTTIIHSMSTSKLRASHVSPTGPGAGDYGDTATLPGPAALRPSVGAGRRRASVLGTGCAEHHAGEEGTSPSFIFCFSFHQFSFSLLKLSCFLSSF